MDLPLPPDFKEFLRLLNSYAIEYLAVGGYAVAYHGNPRLTGDLDAVLDGVPVAIISRDDLIANKLAAGRDRDRDDVSRLRAQ